jgi:hypothetical protein
VTQAHPRGPDPRGAPPGHLRLIKREPVTSARAHLDAIIVPTARAAARLAHSAGLARELKAELLVLCSRDAEPTDAVSVARAAGIEPIVVQVATEAPSAPLRTREFFAGTPFDRNSDTSLKRNVALALSRMAGWQRILFLDDDVEVAGADMLRAAASLLDRYDAVGLRNVGFFDNSVVCHANRYTKGLQPYFVGSGGLLVNTTTIDSYFPDIYNEDWFFLLAEQGLRRVALYGTCAQAAFDPYRDPDRARQEEFGDLVAEGLFWLLDRKRDLDRAGSEAFWVASVRRRVRFIDRIRGRLRDDRPDIAAALDMSRRTVLAIDPAQCVAFLRAWGDDRATWRAYLSGLPEGGSIESSLERLGLQA